MDNFPQRDDPTEDELEIEITDLPGEHSGKSGPQVWLANRLLVWQRSLSRHRRGWRFVSLISTGLLLVVILGITVSNAVGLFRPPAVPVVHTGAAGAFVFATRPSFNPYIYPHSNQPGALYAGQQTQVLDLAWSPDGQSLASGGFNNTILVWHPATKQKLTYRGHSDEVLGLAWSPDGNYIASVSRDATAQIWNATTGKTIWTYRDSTGIFSVAWSPDGRMLAFGDDSGQVQIWNVQTYQKVRTLTGHLSGVLAIAWSPDSTRLATGSLDFTARIWNVATGVSVLTYSGHGDAVSAIAWEPGGRYVASGSSDTTVQVWDPVSGQRILLYQNHKDAVYSLSWSPDGTRLASAGGNMVQVWHLHNGQPIVTYFVNARCVAWSPDEKHIAVGDQAGQVTIWNIQ